MAAGDEEKEAFVGAAVPAETSAENSISEHSEMPSFFCKVIASPDVDTPRSLSALDDLLAAKPDRAALLAHLCRHAQQKAVLSHQAPHAVYGAGLLSNSLPHQRRFFAVHQPLPPLTLLPEPYRYQTFTLNRLLEADSSLSLPADGALRASSNAFFADLLAPSSAKGSSSEAKKAAGSLAAFLLSGPPAPAVFLHRFRQVDRTLASRALPAPPGDNHKAVSAAASLPSSASSSVSALSQPPSTTANAVAPAFAYFGGGARILPRGACAVVAPGAVAGAAFPQAPFAHAPPSGLGGLHPLALGEDGARAFAAAAVARPGSRVGSACSSQVSSASRQKRPMSYLGGGAAPPPGARHGLVGEDEERKKKRKEEKKARKEKKKRKTEA
ncbi:hypothetical protein BESB_058670 [Besnoitia besnoiti]|uniref:Uncharacterized protein n=1 Tax=Besnoitia besnoiti TaxID=94643 RepID=A0A2A9MHU4_BESBE|nr:hypothetical protein BESB_058670 [Besnoitia besnoiti]PFH34980.1 hypothetical protein BESB_058670 [Besnoitia besnoiti]